jgi:hypothetical protein
MRIAGLGFIYDEGHATTLAVPGAYSTSATGIADDGEVVGTYTTDVGGQLYQHGFIDWQGQLKTFDVAGATQTAITGVNDQGQIVGSYTNATGTHGFIGTPEQLACRLGHASHSASPRCQARAPFGRCRLASGPVTLRRQDLGDVRHVGRPGTGRGDHREHAAWRCRVFTPTGRPGRAGARRHENGKLCSALFDRVGANPDPGPERLTTAFVSA